MEPPAMEGPLLVQHSHKFGTKRWKRGWSALYPASQHGVARLEVFDCKEPSAAGRAGTRRLARTVVRLSDCTSVAPVGEGGPLGQGGGQAREHLLGAPSWLSPEQPCPQQCVCVPEQPCPCSVCVSLSSPVPAVNAFWVTVQRTEAAERCELRGTYVLKAERDSLVLKDPRTDRILFVWPYRLLRRYGRDKVMFSFEAGRRCDSGPGNFTFETKQGNEIFRLVEASIQEQKAQVEENRQSCDSLEADSPGLVQIRQALADGLNLELPTEGDDTPAVYSEPLDSVKGLQPWPDPLYSDPVDSKALSGRAEGQGRAEGRGQALPGHKEHIYDEPEGRAPRSLHPFTYIYDEARPTSEAWRTQGHDGRGGYEYPYNSSTDDYSVPTFPAKAKNPKPVPAPKPQAAFIPKGAERVEDPGRRWGGAAPEKVLTKPSLNSSNNNNVEKPTQGKTRLCFLCGTTPGSLALAVPMSGWGCW
uniref:Docking protein 1 n=1 Tax=Serinus canaria TaxID=9135 RepID=A0A8C9N6L3_SERCA